MASDKKEKRVRHTSPARIAVWPKLNEPDTKYNNYGVKLALDPNDETDQRFMAFLDTETDKAVEVMKEEKGKAKAKNMTRGAPYEEELDKEGNETGRMLVNFTMPSVIQNKEKTKSWTLKPALFDAKGTPLPGDVKVGGGSLVKVSYELSPYYIESSKIAGISRRLVAVQVIDLKQWSGGQDASAYGFGEEDGFSIGENAIEGATSGTPSTTPASEF